MQESLPYCGPVPHLKAVNRPGLTESSPPLPPVAKPATAPPSAAAPVSPSAQKPQQPPKPAVLKPQIPPKLAAQRPRPSPKPDMPKSPAPNAPPVPPRSTSVVVPEETEETDEEESDDEEEAPIQLIGRTVSIIRAPSASCRTCPSAWCRAAERLSRQQKTDVHCSTTPGEKSQFLRTASSCYVHGRDTDLSINEGM